MDTYRQISNLPFNDHSLTVKEDHDTNDIIRCIKKYHKVHHAQYDKIAQNFWKGDVNKTAKFLFDFLKRHVRYKIEPEDLQTVKSPGAIIQQGHGDCKHYASFVTGVIDALARSGKPIRSKYRFVADSPTREVHHVFGVAVDRNGNEYWIDPVLSSYNQKPKFFNVKDAQMGDIGRLAYISGTDSDIIGRMHRKFRTPMDIHNHLRKHGMHPKMFRDPQHMARFLHDSLACECGHGHKPMMHHRDGRKPMMHPTGGHKPMMMDHRPGATAVHGWFDNLGEYDTMGDYGEIGKRKKRGQFLKKVKEKIKNAHEKVAHMALKVGNVPARGSFLALVDLNAFNLAHRLHDALKVKGSNRDKLLKAWYRLGGEKKGLINAVNNGYRQYKKHHGGYDINRDKLSVNGIGVLPVAIPAMLALATSIIGVISKFIKASPAEKQAMAGQAAKGALTLVNQVAKGDQQSGGLLPGAADALNDIVKPGAAPGSGTMNISTEVAPDGTPVLTVHDVDHPVLQQGGMHQSADQGHDVSDDLEGGGHVENHSDVSGKITDALSKFKTFVYDNKVPLLIAGTGIVAYKFLSGSKPARRKR